MTSEVIPLRRLLTKLAARGDKRRGIPQISRQGVETGCLLPDRFLEPPEFLQVLAQTGPFSFKFRPDRLRGTIALDVRHYLFLQPCLLYTSDAADERSSVDLG